MLKKRTKRMNARELYKRLRRLAFKAKQKRSPVDRVASGRERLTTF